MKRLLRVGIVILLGLSCLTLTLWQQPMQASNPPKIAQQIDFSRHFKELDVEGSILIYDLKSDRTYQYNEQRNTTPFLPLSTFKILNSLISLETGVIPDEIAVLTWDGIEREFPQWNRDLNMREAIKVSGIWFYQVLARKVGHERMQKWVAQAGYGNKNIGPEEDIDKFWLEGELRITPQEQIAFLRRFYHNELPFSQRSLSLVKDILVVEKTPEYTIRGKTGWMPGTTPEIGWYVGYLERDENVYFFAVNIEIRKEGDTANRLELMRRCFQDLQLL